MEIFLATSCKGFKIAFLFALLIISTDVVSAQSPKLNEAILEKYSKHSAVITKQESHYIFDIVQDTLQVKQNVVREALIINDNSKIYTNDQVYYGSFTSIENLNAATLLPKNNGYERIRVSRFNETHDFDRNVFFDGFKTINFSYPSLIRGAITTVSYSNVYHDARFVRPIYLQSHIPVVNSKTTIKVHRDIAIGYKMFNTESLNHNFRQYSKGKYNYYEWEANDVEPIKYLGSDNFSIRYHSPHIAPYVKNVVVNGQKQEYYSSVKELYQYYHHLISRMNNATPEGLSELVNRITSGLNDLEKARAIYYWVQQNIKYIAYVEGYMGFVPASPSEVFQKRFGDCKGMSAIIKKMLELADLPAYFAWVGTRRLPYTYEELPLPSVDNHMVAALLHDDTVLILDGTFKYLDFGIYPYHIQGKEVLISIDEDNYKIFKVPVSSPSSNVVVDSVSISLKDKTIFGNGRRMHTGFNKIELASAMDGVRETDFARSFARLFQKGNNKFKIIDFQIENIFKHDEPAIVNYYFELNDYVNVFENEIYLNLNLDKSFQNLTVDTTRQFSPVTNDFPYTEKHITRFEIPKGFEVSSVPENDIVVSENFRISFSYSQKENYLLLEREMIFDFQLLLQDQIGSWNSMIEKLNQNYRKSVVFKKKL
jgi:hypothetical protein